MGRPPAPMSNQEKGEVMRAQILAAAVPLVAQRGGRGVSLSQVAAASGVSKTGLMHHFNTKEALLHAVLDVRDAEDGYPQLWSPDIGADVLDLVVIVAQRWREGRPTLGMFTILLAENLPEDAPLHERVLRRALDIENRIAETIEAGKRAGSFRDDLDAEQAAAEMLLFINGLEVYTQLRPNASTVQLASNWRIARLREWQPES